MESPATPPPGLSQVSAMTAGRLPQARARSKASSGERNSGLQVPRIEKISRPNLSAKASPAFVASSVTTSTRVPISGTSPAMNPWIKEIDNILSRPSSAFIRSTKPRIGSRLVYVEM